MALKRKRVRLPQTTEQPKTPATPVVFRPGLGDHSFREAQQQLEIDDPKDFVASREFGLGMALVGLAESQMQRLPHLLTLLRGVEDRLNTPEFLEMVKARGLELDLQKALSNGVEQSAKTIAHVFESVDLEKLRLLRERNTKKRQPAIEIAPAQEILDAPQTVQQPVNPLALLHALHQRSNVGH
jgi:hypothetical protein